METIEGILSQEKDYSSTSSSSSELSSLTPFSISNACSRKRENVRKRNGEERLPTRRPDPNVYNRNALLARENRRKKKMYLESLERELQEARKANHVLAKALKRQVNISRQLEQQKKYFQNIIAHRTEISNIFSILSNRESPDQLQSALDAFADSSCNRDLPSDSFSSSSYDPEPLSSDFGFQSGSVTDRNQNEMEDISSFDFCNIPNFFTDLEDGASFANSSWNDPWTNDDNHMVSELTRPVTTEFTQMSGMLKGSLLTIFDDHCYMGPSDLQTSPQQLEIPSFADAASQNDNVSTAATESKGCIHINRGKDSHFCPTCHWNSASQNPPLQLLSDELLL